MTAASDLAERLREEVADHPVAANGSEIAITVSIGGAKAIPGLDPVKIVEAADAALYRAKTTGRNRVVLIDEFGAHRGGVVPLDQQAKKGRTGGSS